ncbi:MAG: DUF433 domain-containing protein [Isosphaeraceae bacterium]
MTDRETTTIQTQTGEPTSSPTLDRSRIVSTPGTCCGKPRIDGHRITVKQLVLDHQRQGLTPLRAVFGSIAHRRVRCADRRPEQLVRTADPTIFNECASRLQTALGAIPFVLAQVIASCKLRLCTSCPRLHGG